MRLIYAPDSLMEDILARTLEAEERGKRVKAVEIDTDEALLLYKEMTVQWGIGLMGFQEFKRKLQPDSLEAITINGVPIRLGG